jgi:hypothetical protein
MIMNISVYGYFVTRARRTIGSCRSRGRRRRACDLVDRLVHEIDESVADSRGAAVVPLASGAQLAHRLGGVDDPHPSRRTISRASSHGISVALPFCTAAIRRRSSSRSRIVAELVEVVRQPAQELAGELDTLVLGQLFRKLEYLCQAIGRHGWIMRARRQPVEQSPAHARWCFGFSPRRHGVKRLETSRRCFDTVGVGGCGRAGTKASALARESVLSPTP